MLSCEEENALCKVLIISENQRELSAPWFDCKITWLLIIRRLSLDGDRGNLPEAPPPHGSATAACMIGTASSTVLTKTLIVESQTQAGI